MGFLWGGGGKWGRGLSQLQKNKKSGRGQWALSPWRFGCLTSTFFPCFPGNFKGLCKQIDHFPEDADYEADTAEYFLREWMQFFFISLLVMGPALPSLSAKGQNYLEVSVTAEGRKKLSLLSSPLSMAKPSGVLFSSTRNALPPLFVGKFLHIFQVSGETTPPPRSPLCPWRGSQSLASLSCCWVHVCLSNQLPDSVANSTRTLIELYLSHSSLYSQPSARHIESTP